MQAKDLILYLMTGADIPVASLKAVVHPPSIKEIAYMGESDFFLGMQYLCVQKELVIEDRSVLNEVKNFQVFMELLSGETNKDAKLAVLNLLRILFPDRSAAITQNSIILPLVDKDKQGETVLIDISNFDDFQDLVREILCVNSVFQAENIVYKPANEAAAKIAAKLMKGRQKVAQIKEANGENNDSLLGKYLSILALAVPGYTLADCANLNLFQLFDLVERYSAYTEWDLDLRVRIAGGKPDKQVESWTRELHSTKQI